MDPQSHQLSLRLIERCPACRTRIAIRNVHIIQETQHNILTHMSCTECNSKFLTMIVHYPHGLTGNSMPTDLTYDEVTRMRQQEAITEDEFLELYRAVKSGSFIEKLHIRINS